MRIKNFLYFFLRIEANSGIDTLIGTRKLLMLFCLNKAIVTIIRNENKHTEICSYACSQSSQRFLRIGLVDLQSRSSESSSEIMFMTYSMIASSTF